MITILQSCSPNECIRIRYFERIKLQRAIPAMWNQNIPQSIIAKIRMFKYRRYLENIAILKKKNKIRQEARASNNVESILPQISFWINYERCSSLSTYEIRGRNSINRRHYRNHNARYDASTKLRRNQQHCASKRRANCTREWDRMLRLPPFHPRDCDSRERRNVRREYKSLAAQPTMKLSFWCLRASTIHHLSPSSFRPSVRPPLFRHPVHPDSLSLSLRQM